MKENVIEWLLGLEKEKLDQLEAEHGKIEDMTIEEMKKEMRGYLFKKECKRWEWILTGGGKKIMRPSFHVDGTVTWESDHSEEHVLKQMLRNERWYAVGRYTRSKQAARTRRLLKQGKAA